METFCYPEPTRGSRLALLLAFACVLASLSTTAIRPAVAGPSIGLYADPAGSSCSLSGNSPGMFTAYVVVRPDEFGVRAVQFAAQIPSCLGATFVKDHVPAGMLAIGSSPTGIHVALQVCSFDVVNVLEITYLRSNTTPCCEFSLVADPLEDKLVAVSCGYEKLPLTSVVSHFHADASCACVGNSAPRMPVDPSPYDGEPGVIVGASFTWGATDVDGNLAEFDVYMGTSPSPPLVASELTQPAYTPADPLTPLAQHYWRVVARDALGLETSSATWTFTTRAVNSPPYQPQNLSPANAAQDVPLDAPLRWVGGDIDGDPVLYDVYFGPSTPPPLVATDVVLSEYAPGPLTFDTIYYWRIVARDTWEQESSSQIWWFEARQQNYPPRPPSVIAPASGAVGVSVTPILAWTVGDIDPDTLVSDVYFGTSPTPPLVESGSSATTYDPGPLSFSTQYFWRVVVRDQHEAETSGQLWGFTTRPENYPPTAPNSPSPANGAVNRLESTTLAWQCSDLDGHAITYDVYFGTESPPPLVATDVPTKTYAPGPLAFATTYRWRIVARDALGAETAGAEWTFQTRANRPPNVPVNVSPSNGAVNRPLNSTLTWACTDPDGHALTFDVYFGTSSPPPLVATDVPVKSYTQGTLAFATSYHWQIVARDAFGLERPGPVWVFTTRPENYPPNAPSSPLPANGAVNRSIISTLGWACTDPDGNALTFDVYFGTSSPPPLVASDVPERSYSPGVLAFATLYHWQIVARDALGGETPGPVWSFTTKTNSAPAAPSNPSPSNHGVSGQAPVLTWNCTDPDGQALTYDVYFGSTSPPPLAASGLTVRSFEPGTLSFGQYFWHVVASDGLLSVSGLIWDFRAAQLGDVSLDGAISAQDASCALGVYVYSGPCLAGAPLADVNCSGSVTPRDARCIHKHVVDGSCAFCGGPAQTAPGGVQTPLVSVSTTWEWNDTVYVRLSVSGVPSFEAFGFTVRSIGSRMKAVRRGATNDFAGLRSSSPFPGTGIVGGYSLSGADADSPVEFIELRFYAYYPYEYAVVTNFVDDLAGANPLSFDLSGNGIPVLITRFDAAAVEDGVDVRWELQSDEAMESYTLYRREDGEALPITIAQGPATSRSYRDASVEGGKTYHYELLIRAVAGGEFRSQTATVSTGALMLSLGQNHPNPFNPQTTIPYDLPHSDRRERVRLWILDISGRVVATLVDEEQGGGSYRVTWQGRDNRGEAVSSGVYFYVLDAGGQRRTKKLVLLK